MFFLGLTPVRIEQMLCNRTCTKCLAYYGFPLLFFMCMVRAFLFCAGKYWLIFVSHYNDVIMSDGVSNHQPHDCLLNRLFRRKSKKTSKLRVTGLCVGNSPVTGEFPTQRTSDSEDVSIWWRHHDIMQPHFTSTLAISVKATIRQQQDISHDRAG